ncbi:hypothetical protein HJD18_11930 [Thermoleophilia bacterium SCSIO 60948]|nr:hypothetical protein HJD18_11930 [Thermoleophilia bacterium SCSIO 60948]
MRSRSPDEGATFARRSGLILAVLALVATVLSFAGPASAGTPGPTESRGKSLGLEYMRARYEAVASQTSQTAECSGSRRAIGGGGNIGGGAGGPDFGRLNESYPVQDGSGWVAEASTNGVEASDLYAYAICSKRPQTVAVDGPFEFIGPDRTFIATCPGGYTATGGGFSSLSVGLEMLTTGRAPSSTTARVWRTRALNESGGAAEGTGYAACSKGYRVRIQRTKSLDVPVDFGGAVTARCRRDEAVAGGGWTTRGQNGARGLAIQVARPLDSGDRGKVPDDGWTVRASSTGEAGTLAAQAICVRPLRR